MNISTERVLNAQFDAAILPSLLKASQEYRVLATLRYVYPTKYNNLIRDDRPDLRDNTNKVGIEVTIWNESTEMQVSREFSKLNCGISSSKQRDIISFIESTGFHVSEFSGKRTLSGPISTVQHEKRLFSESVLNKIKKIREYRQITDKIGLAVLIDLCSSEMIENLPAWIAEIAASQTDFFDFLYIVGSRFCLYYDCKTRKSNYTTIPAEDELCLKKIGRLTAEKKLTLQSPEWN